MGEMTDDLLNEEAGMEIPEGETWALAVAARHADRHWCWGHDSMIGYGQFMFGGPMIGRDCDARNAALALTGALHDASEGESAR